MSKVEMMNITHLELQTRDLQAQADYYSQALELGDVNGKAFEVRGAPYEIIR